VADGERERVWAAVGAALAASPALGSLAVAGTPAAAALAGLGAAAAAAGASEGGALPPPVRRLHLAAGGGDDGAAGDGGGGSEAADALGAALRAVSATLDWLGVDAHSGWGAGGLARALASSGGLPSLRHAELRLTASAEVVDAATAAAVAAAAPALRTLVLDAPVAGGWGDAWSAAAGALPRLAVLRLHVGAGADAEGGGDGVDDGSALVAGVSALLRGRALDGLSLSAAAPLPAAASAGLVDALLGGSALPTSLDLTGLPLDGADVRRLAADPRAAADVRVLAVGVPPEEDHPACVASLEGLGGVTALRLRVRAGAVTPSSAAAAATDAPWAGLPRLASLTVDVAPALPTHGAGADGGGDAVDDDEGPPSAAALLGWLASAAAAAPCASSLTDVTVTGAVGWTGVTASALGPLADAVALRALTVTDTVGMGDGGGGGAATSPAASAVLAALAAEAAAEYAAVAAGVEAQVAALLPDVAVAFGALPPSG